MTCGLLSKSVFGQWSFDPGINNVVSTPGTSMTWPAIIPGGNGSVIIAWSDYRNGNMNSDIFVQRLNAQGQPEWAVDGLAVCTAPNNQQGLLIVPDGAGGAIIAWSDYRHSDMNGYHDDIYAQHIKASGQLTWMKDGIPVCIASNGQSPYSMTSDRNGGAIVAWHDYRNGSFSNIYVQHIKNDGTMGWISNGLQVCPQPNSQEFPAVMVNDAGNAIIAWSDAINDVQILAQMIAPDGKLKWAPNGVVICSASHATVALPSIIPSGEQGAIIAWLDGRRRDLANIYAQRISNEAALQWQTDGVEIGRSVRWQRKPQMVSDNHGGAIITWDDYRTGYQTGDTYAQKVNGNGIVEWAQYGVAICTAEGNQFGSSIAPDGMGGAIITWGDSRDGVTNTDVYAQHINTEGTIGWMENGIIISSAPGRQVFPAILSLPGRGAFIAWNDGRHGGDPGNSIYAQNVNLNGKLGCFTPVIINQPLPSQPVWQGRTATSLKVSITGESLKYQWYSNTTTSTNGAVSLFPTGTEATYTPSTVNEGTLYYYCMITGQCDTLYSDFAEVTVNIPITRLEVKVSPNPTIDFFNVTIKSPINETLYIRMFDMLGRLVEFQQAVPGQTFKLGEWLASAMYLIEVRQGEEIVVTKAVKQ